MKNKTYHTVGTIPKLNIKIVKKKQNRYPYHKVVVAVKTSMILLLFVHFLCLYYQNIYIFYNPTFATLRTDDKIALDKKTCVSITY